MKYRILQELRKNSKEYVSGEALSGVLGVTRTSVWKHINELKNEGYVIEATSRKGYRLLDGPDILNAGEISYGLKTQTLGRYLHFFNAIDSTNNHAKRLAFEGCEEGTVVTADIQTAGRGRLGRLWDSKGGRGIWMSVVLKPSVSPEDVQVITLGASVAVVKAIKNVTCMQAGIKWPNDIILGGKKVCGILTEMNCEIGRINFIVLGIGINVNHDIEDFPEELRNTAVSLKIHGSEASSQAPVFRRSDIIKNVLLELERIYSKINSETTEKTEVKDIINEWKKFSVTIGSEVRFNIKGAGYTGTAVDITGEGRLVVNCTDGTTREILSDEISIRGMLGYT